MRKVCESHGKKEGRGEKGVLREGERERERQRERGRERERTRERKRKRKCGHGSRKEIPTTRAHMFQIELGDGRAIKPNER